MKTKAVSVIIDTYNYEHFIEQAIESVLNQDFPKEQMEIIVVDDGSTDDTREKVKKYEGRIKYIYQENKGQAGAFNTGFSAATGEYICFLDADDVWYPDKLNTVVEKFQKYPEVGLVQHQSEYVDINGKKKERKLPVLPEFYIVNDLLKGDALFYGTSNLSFRRKFLKEIMPEPEEMGNYADQYLYCNILFYSRAYSINTPLAAHRIHTSNWYAKMFNNTKMLEMHIKVLEKVNFYVEQRAKQLNLIQKNQKLYVNPLIGITREKVILYRKKGEFFNALKALFEVVRSGITPFVLFKSLTLLVAIFSPRVYLKLFEVYSQKAILPKLRMRFFPDNYY